MAHAALEVVREDLASCIADLAGQLREASHGHVRRSVPMVHWLSVHWLSDRRRDAPSWQHMQTTFLLSLSVKTPPTILYYTQNLHPHERPAWSECGVYRTAILYTDIEQW